MQTLNRRMTELHRTIQLIAEHGHWESSSLETYIKQNYICNIEGARVFSTGGIITIVDLKSISDERILRFIQVIKHSEKLMNVLFLSDEEWESLNNFIKTLEDIDVSEDNL